MPDHLTPITSDRGFARLPSVPGTHGGLVRTYESSAAMAPHLWLQAVDTDGREVVLHLTAENAWYLGEQLAYLVEHHYQGDARPHAATEGDSDA